jgi:luciferase family oxidoreductase group 1
MAIPLSALDQSPIAAGQTAGDALRNSVDLAEALDRLGFSRLWLAEHHGTAMLAGTSPEVLIGPVAAATRHLRVGSGGVMLPHYSPLKVAESFGVLGALFPGRIDLAVGRAAGSDPLTAFALQRERRLAQVDDFPEQLSELLAYVRDGLPAGHRFAHVLARAAAAERVTPWLLGSSAQSGVWAAELGLPYAFADFINPAGAEIAGRYRDSFVPSVAQERPYVIVAAWALVAETEEEAERLGSSSRMAFIHFLQGTPIPVPPVDTAVEFLRANPDAVHAARRRRRAVIGTAPQVRAELERLAAAYQADEIMVVTITYEHRARKESYERLAHEMRR